MKRFYDMICRAEMCLAIATLIGTTFVIFLAAVFRTFGMPLNWSLDMCLFLFAWCVFLSADVALRKELMVSFDLVTRMCGPRTNRVFAIIIYCILIAFLLLFVGYGFLLCYKTRLRPFQGIPSVSYMWLTLAAPVCGILMLVTCALKLRRLFLGLPTMEPGATETAEHNAAS